MYKQVLTILLNFNILIHGFYWQMKQIDDTFVSHIDNILNHEHETELEAKQPKENGPMLSEPSPGLLKHVK